MHGRYLFAGVLLIAASMLAVAAQRAVYPELFQSIWQAVNDDFYDPGFTGVDWNRIREKYAPQIGDVKDDATFLRLMTRMLGELPVSHLSLLPPQKSQSVGIGIRTRRIEGSSVITEVAAASDASRHALRPGDIVLNSAAIPGAPGTAVEVMLQGCDGRKRTARVRREQAWWPPQRPSLRWHVIRQNESRSIGYLRALRFDDDVAPLADQAMKDLAHTSALIIDVRGNSGGNVSYLRLASYFFGPRLAFALLSRAYLKRWPRAPENVEPDKLPVVSGAYTTEAILGALRKHEGGAAFYTEEPPWRYAGEIIVLVDEQTGSAAEGFAWNMLSHPKVTLIGRKTAGALLGGERFPLPHGWSLTVPTHAAWGPDGRLHRDQSVTPHVQITWTRQDVYEGRDPDMAAALDRLEKENRP